jgi:hypothetical protein
LKLGEIVTTIPTIGKYSWRNRMWFVVTYVAS